MFWLLKFLVKWTLRIKVIVFAVLVGMGIAYGQQWRARYQTWGIIASEQDRDLPGDDLVADPDLVETRSLTIDAPPSAVWPWLAQMGHGRGGWYSYQQLDRAWSPSGGPFGDRGVRHGVDARESSDVILEEYQDLAEGDLVPTHPGGGFVARVVEPDATLVLFLDEQMTREQVEEMVADGSDEAREAMSDMDMPPFTLSWSFVLESVGTGRTRLTERMRVHVEDISDAQRRGVPLLKMGAFVLMRSQMLGIQERAEQGGLARSVGEPEADA